MKKKKRSRLVQRHMKAVDLAKGMLDEAMIDIYNTLCTQPLKHRVKTAWRILCGKKLGE